MADGIRLSVSNDTVSATLDRIDRVADNPAAIMADIASFLVQRSEHHIETETGPDGKWQPLSPRTAAKRSGRSRRGTAHMLRVSNRLYSSITGDSSATEAAVGTNVIYAAVQQLGGTVQIPEREQEIHLVKTNRGQRFARASAKRSRSRVVKIGAHTITIPARPYLYLTDEDAAEIELIAQEGYRREADLK